MDRQNLTLLTDLYELTMMQGYFKHKDQNETVIFDAFYRTNPGGGGYSIAAGLEQVIEYIKELHFSKEDIEYLASLRIFDKDFLDYLKISNSQVISMQFPRVLSCSPRTVHQGHCTDYAAQLIETAILNIINHQSLIATKAARVCYAAKVTESWNSV